MKCCGYIDMHGQYIYPHKNYDKCITTVFMGMGEVFKVMHDVIGDENNLLEVRKKWKERREMGRSEEKEGRCRK